MSTAAPLEFRPARPEEASTVEAVLAEAATWLEQRGIALWPREMLSLEAIAPVIAASEFWLALSGGAPAGVFMFQWEDPLCWPDAAPGIAAYLHRIAVRRSFAGGAVSGAILTFAAWRAHGAGRKWLRLDCDAARPRLRDVYERFGFRYHSDFQLGEFRIARYQLSLPLSSSL